MENNQLLTEKDAGKRHTENVTMNDEPAEPLFLVVSGKMGAGKDTIAPLVLERLGYTDTKHLAFADPLKNEVNLVIQIIQESDTPREAIDLVNEKLNTTKAFDIVVTLYGDVKNGVVTSGYDKTTTTRLALQYWGTEVRRSQDENYWVKRTIAECNSVMNKNTSVYITDARFPNEVDATVMNGAVHVRLIINEEEQRKRILKRDGIEISPDSLVHTSETALDDYEAALKVDTSGVSVDEVVNTIVDYLK